MSNLFIKCPNCKKTHYEKILLKNLYVCPDCDYHDKMHSWSRVKIIADKGSFKEFDTKLKSGDPLGFPKYADRLKRAMKETRENEAVKYGEGKIDGHPAVIIVMEPRFIMASMGSVVGEKITRAFEYATKNALPLVAFCASGGARMQEGILSLMQMAKTSAAVKKHSDRGLLYVSVLCHPTTGGVTASFAYLGDIIIAEPNALIGFAGPRVIEQTINQKLPHGFQRAEFLLEHGLLDKIVPRSLMKETIANILKIHSTAKVKKSQYLIEHYGLKK